MDDPVQQAGEFQCLAVVQEGLRPVAAYTRTAASENTSAGAAATVPVACSGARSRAYRSAKSGSRLRFRCTVFRASGRPDAVR